MRHPFFFTRTDGLDGLSRLAHDRVSLVFYPVVSVCFLLLTRSPDSTLWLLIFCFSYLMLFTKEYLEVRKRGFPAVISLLILVSFVFQGVFYKTPFEKFQIILPWGALLGLSLLYVRPKNLHRLVSLGQSPIFWFCAANIAASILSILGTSEAMLLHGLKHIVIFLLPILFFLAHEEDLLEDVFIKSTTVISLFVILKWIFTGFIKPDIKPLFQEMSWCGEFLLIGFAFELIRVKKIGLRLPLIFAALLILSSLACLVAAALILVYVFLDKVGWSSRFLLFLTVILAIALVSEWDRVDRFLSYGTDDSSLGRLQIYSFLFDADNGEIGNLPRGFESENILHFSGGVGWGALGSVYLSQITFLYGWYIGYVILVLLIYMMIRFYFSKKRHQTILSMILFISSLAHPIFVGINASILMYLIMRYEFSDEDFLRRGH